MTPIRTTRTRKQTRVRTAAAVAMAAAIVAATAAGCGSADGVVGGACATSYTQCGLSCVNLETDKSNCGACGHECGPSVACVKGVCLESSFDATADGSETDANEEEANADAESFLDGEFCDANQPGCHRGDSGNVDDGASDGDSSSSSGDGASEGSIGDGSTPDGSTVDASHDGSVSDSGGGPVDACAPPFNTPAACGACGVTCAAPNPICSLEDGGYECAPTCAPPLVQCEGHCVNLSRDPDNCGVCGTVCASQYCYLATCQGNVAGSIMVIGHDFDTTKSTDQEAKLLTNAVFYNPPTVHLLSFEHYANAAAVTNAKGILTAYATTQHYSLTITATSDDAFIDKGLTISNEDAVIVWDQPTAPAGTLGALGTQWGPSLSKFAQEGGLVIVLDAAQGTGEMPALETNAALLAVTGHTVVATGTPADVPLAGLSIARGMTNVYVVGTNTASFTTSEPASLRTLFVANVQGQTTQLLAVQKIVN
jgi:hypothetical protein